MLTDTHKSLNNGAISSENLTRKQAIRNTEYTNDKFNLTYHCGTDIFNNHLNLDFKDELVMKYLHGEQISYDVSNGFGVLRINQISLGGYKASGNNLNNYYPKGLRNF